MINLGSAYGEIIIGTDQAQRNVQTLAQQMNNVGRNLSLAVTAPLVGIAGAALQSAAGFETAMNQVEVIASATGDQMANMEATALQLGAQTSFSAGEAAQGMLELAKAGFNADESMAAIAGTLDLAAAGGLGVAQAAEISSNVLNAFNLPAEQAGYVANLLAAAANSSSVEVTDMAYAFQMAGSVFASNKQPVDQLAAAIAILGNNGLKGSDAGTSMKTMLMRLTAPTDKAAGVMADLGLQVYNADGSMRMFDDILSQLVRSTANLTDEQRNQALTTVFGADAIRAANILIGEGSAAFAQMTTDVNKAGSAQEVANARMKGLAGAVEYFKGSLDSLLIAVAKPFLDMLGEMVRGAADLLSGFTELPQPVINAALAFLGVLAAAGPLMLALSGLGTVLAALLSPVGLVVVAVAGLAAAFASDFMGIRTIAMQVAGGFADLWDAMGWIWQGKADNIDWWTDIAEAFGLTGDAALAVGDRLFELGVRAGAVVGAFRSFGVDAIGEVIAQLTGFGLETYDTTEAIEGLVTALTGSEAAGAAAGQWIFDLGTSFQNFRNQAVLAWLALSASVQQAWGTIGPIVQALGARVAAAISAMIQGFAGLGPQLSALGGAFASLWAAVSPILMQLGTLIAGTLGVVAVVAINYLAAAFAALPATVGVAIGALTATIEAVATIVSSVTAAVAALLQGDFAGAWQAAQGAVAAVLGWLSAMVSAFVASVGIAWGALKATIAGTLTSLGFAEVAAQIDAIEAKVAAGWLAIKDAVTVAVQNFSWADFIGVFSWDTVTTALSWADWIGALAWSSFVAMLSDWGAYVASIDWTAFVVQLLDWAAWIPALAWNGFVSALDWATYLITLDWGGYISALAWSTYATALSWATYIGQLIWGGFVGVLGWADWVGGLSWDTYISGALDWASYVGSVTWSSFVDKLEWPADATTFAWSSWVSKLRWPTISWPGFDTFVKALAWPIILWPGFGTFVKALVWPVISWPGFGTFVKNLSWPSISWPGWSSFIPNFSWPSLPAFPGWDSLIPDFLGGGDGKSLLGRSLLPDIGGVSDLGRLAPTGRSLLPAGAGTGVAGGGDVNVYLEGMVIQHPQDIHETAWELGNLTRRYGRR